MAITLPRGIQVVFLALPDPGRNDQFTILTAANRRNERRYTVRPAPWISVHQRTVRSCTAPGIGNIVGREVVIARANDTQRLLLILAEQGDVTELDWKEKGALARALAHIR